MHQSIHSRVFIDNLLNKGTSALTKIDDPQLPFSVEINHTICNSLQHFNQEYTII